MSIKNSEFRDFAQTAQSRHDVPFMTWIAVGLVIVIPMIGVFAWRSPVVQQALMRGKPTATAVAAAPAPAADPAPMVAVAKTTPESAGLRPALGDQKSTGFSPVQAASLAFKIKMNPDLTEEFMGSLIEIMKDSTRDPKAPVSDKDVFAWCRARNADTAPILVRQKRSEEEKDRIAFDIMSASLLCVMQRPQQRLCQKPVRERMVRQIKLYATVRDETLGASTGGARESFRRHLDQGVHKAIAGALKSLATRGIVLTGDFGYRKATLISDVVAPVKDVKPACAG